MIFSGFVHELKFNMANDIVEELIEQNLRQSNVNRMIEVLNWNRWERKSKRSGKDETKNAGSNSSLGISWTPIASSNNSEAMIAEFGNILQNGFFAGFVS